MKNAYGVYREKYPWESSFPIKVKTLEKNIKKIFVKRGTSSDVNAGNFDWACIYTRYRRHDPPGPGILTVIESIRHRCERTETPF